MAYVHVLVKTAIRNGELTRSLTCDACGLIRATWAHHDDYAKPLEVRWLCKPCHAEWHRLNGPGMNVEIADLHPAKKHPQPKEKREPRSKKKHHPHHDEMVALIAEGWTLQKVGDKFGVTREYIRQIVGSPFSIRPRKDLLAAAREHLEQINDMRLAGKKLVQIEAETGISKGILVRLPLAKKAFRHGTGSGYKYHKCRCEECTTWGRTEGTKHAKATYRLLRERSLCVSCEMPSKTARCQSCYKQWYAKRCQVSTKEQVHETNKEDRGATAERVKGTYEVEGWA